MDLSSYGLLLLEAWVAVVVLTSTACVIVFITVASIFSNVMASPDVQVIVKAARSLGGGKGGGGDWKAAVATGGLKLVEKWLGGNE